MKMIMAAAALLMMTACCGTKNVSLEGTLWKLSNLEGIPAEAIAIQPDAFTLTFNVQEMRVNGMGNCNRVFGSYAIEGNKIDFENMAMTRMACPDMQYEDLFTQMLDEADRFEIKGKELKLYDDLVHLATFEAMPALASAEQVK